MNNYIIKFVWLVIAPIPSAIFWPLLIVYPFRRLLSEADLRYLYLSCLVIFYFATHEIIRRHIKRSPGRFGL